VKITVELEAQVL